MRRLLLRFLPLLAASAGLLGGQVFVVVPFANLSGGQNVDWIGESLSEAIRETLVRSDVPVVSRDEREEMSRHLALKPFSQPTKATSMRLALALGAHRLLHGEFNVAWDSDSEAPSSGRLTVTARVIELDRMSQGPEWREEGAMTDLGRLQRQLAWKMLQYAAPAKASSKAEFEKQYPATRLDAIESYIRGLLSASPEQKHRLFAQAVRLDPEFSQACYQIGLMLWEENRYRSAMEWLERVKPGDACYLEAGFLLGVSRFHAGDYEGALAAFDEVRKRLPVAMVFNNLGVVLFRMNDPGAVGYLRRAAEEEPEAADYQFNLGYVLWRQGEIDAAAEFLGAAVEIDPLDSEAADLLERCRNQSSPRRGDLSSGGLERLNDNLGEIVYRRRTFAARSSP